MGTESWDRILLDECIRNLHQEHGMDLYSDKPALNKLRKKIEASRRSLKPNTPLNFDFLDKGEKRKVLLEPESIWLAVRSHHQELVSFCRQAVSDTGIADESIRRILVAGGGIQIPFLVDAVEEGLGKKIFYASTPPEEIIARGAVINGLALMFGKAVAQKGAVLDMPEVTQMRTTAMPLEEDKTKITSHVKPFMISLTTMSKEDPPQVFENQAEVSIGRGSGNHIIFDIGAISRVHAKIEFHDGTFFIIDRSSNGTFLNEQRLVKWQRRKLKEGDMINLASATGPWIKIVSVV